MLNRILAVLSSTLVSFTIQEVNQSAAWHLATKIDRSVNLDKQVFNASSMKDPQHEMRQALPVAGRTILK